MGPSECGLRLRLRLRQRMHDVSLAGFSSSHRPAYWWMRPIPVHKPAVQCSAMQCSVTCKSCAILHVSFNRRHFAQSALFTAGVVSVHWQIMPSARNVAKCSLPPADTLMGEWVLPKRSLLSYMLARAHV